MQKTTNYMNDSVHTSNNLNKVFYYHQKSKHHLQRYADGPGYLDWANQPDPFRRYEGARLLKLGKKSKIDGPLYDEIFQLRKITPAPLDIDSISQLFYDSMAISAWKSIGTDKWPLRVNPSSGNLHPTESYLLSGPVEGLNDKPMVCHYGPKEHGLEVRAELELQLWKELCEQYPEGTLFIGITSILWREAWKYGYRAYRYCQLDVGHAISAFSIAAAGLGWQAIILDDLGTDDLAFLTGTFLHNKAEPEEPDLLMALCPGREDFQSKNLPAGAINNFKTLHWQGVPNQLSKSQIDWGMDVVAEVVRKPCNPVQYEGFQKIELSEPMESRQIYLRKIIHQRRSAMQMNGITEITRDTFYSILQKTIPSEGAVPFTALPWRPHIHLALFVHRVIGLDSGLYLLVRDPSQKKVLQDALSLADSWQRPAECPAQLDLYTLAMGDTRESARQVACHQEIAGESCFSVGMLAEFEESLHKYGSWFYQRLFWEAGVIGQVLYLEAEAAGVRGTGIGCYFDDLMHEIIGITDRRYQDFYHFTVGGPIEDARLTTLPPYHDD